MGEGEDAVDGIPELGHGTCQKRALLRGTTRRGESCLETHGIVEIGPNSLELCRPGCKRIGLIAADHVTHGYGQQVEIILDAEELEGVSAIAVDEVGLELSQSGDLPGDVSGISNYGRQGDE